MHIIQLLSLYLETPMNNDACVSSKWCGPPSWSSPFRGMCFQPPYQTACSEPALNCLTTYATRGSCYFNAECAGNAQCINGSCASFKSNVPRAIARVTPQELEAYVQSTMGNTATINQAKCKEPLLMVEHNGKREVVCPLPYERGSMPQCKYALQRVWQCDRYQGINQDAFEQCNQFKDCFLYDIEFPGGQTHPVGVKMNNMCLGAADAALRETASRCSTASVW